MKNDLPEIPTVRLIHDRLQIIFPPGTQNRNYVTREMTAKIIFVMFYTGAIESNDVWLRPDQVTKMSDAQAERKTQDERIEWRKLSLSPGKLSDVQDRWYAANTREPIRDESLRGGLVSLGAVIERQDLATTSSKPRYALEKEFARLFDSSLRDKALLSEIESWQERHLSAAALARIRLKKRGFDDSESDKYVLIKLPNGEVRQMAPGPSSVLSKNVIEIFAHRYLNKPALLFLSESGNKIIEQDNELAISLNLKIEIAKNLPDIIIVDIEPQEALLVFIEVVVTDGAITSDRYKSLLEIALSAGFNEKNVVFVTAFSDRGDSAFRRLSSDIAWNSIIWFATEPEHLIIRTSESEKKITHILDLF